MSDADPGKATAAPAHDSRHDDAADQDSGHGHGHGHEDEVEPLGPPDLMGWAYAAAGGAVGLVTALALYVAAHA
jgi:hypothetical protein